MSWARSPARPRVTAKTHEIYATNTHKEQRWQLVHRLYNNQLHKLDAVSTTDASEKKKKKKNLPAGAASSKEDPSSSSVEEEDDPEAHMKPSCPQKKYLLTELSSQEIGRTSRPSLMVRFNEDHADWRLTYRRHICNITREMESPGAAWQRQPACDVRHKNLRLWR